MTKRNLRAYGNVVKGAQDDKKKSQGLRKCCRGVQPGSGRKPPTLAEVGHIHRIGSLAPVEHPGYSLKTQRLQRAILALFGMAVAHDMGRDIPKNAGLYS